MTEESPTLRPGLPELPGRMRRLPVHRGYPVPWFVAWLDEDGGRAVVGEGVPEFRLMDEAKLVRAVRESLCWVCGDKLGRFKAYVIGPMCLVNKVNAEPPSHLDCADFSARACPFLTRPHMVRREDKLPDDLPEMAGIGVKRNPGIACVYITDRPVSHFRAANNDGVLFALPSFTEVRFYAEGRKATLEEIEHSIETGLPALIDVCQTEEERQEVVDRAAKALVTALAASTARN